MREYTTYTNIKTCLNLQKNIYEYQSNIKRSCGHIVHTSTMYKLSKSVIDNIKTNICARCELNLLLS